MVNLHKTNLKSLGASITKLWMAVKNAENVFAFVFVVFPTIMMNKAGYTRSSATAVIPLRSDCLHMVQLMPLPSQTPSSRASLKSRLVLPLVTLAHVHAICYRRRRYNNVAALTRTRWHRLPIYWLVSSTHASAMHIFSADVSRLWTMT